MGKPVRKKKRNNPFNQKTEADEIGSAYDEKCLIDTSAKEFVYDDVDGFAKDLEDEEIQLTTKRLRTKKAEKTNVLSLGLDDSGDERRGKATLPEGFVSSSSDEEEEETERPNKAFRADEDFLSERKEEEKDDRAWGTDRDVFFGSNVTDHESRKRARAQHKEEEHTAALLELEAGAEYRARMAEARSGVDWSSLLGWDVEEAKEEQSQKKKKKKRSVDAAVVLSAQAHSSEEHQVPYAKPSLSEAHKCELFRRLNPEYDAIEAVCSKNMSLVSCLYEPVYEALKEELTASRPAVLLYLRAKLLAVPQLHMYLQSYVHMLLTEVTSEQIRQHSIMQDLFAHVKMLKDLEPLDAVMHPQLEKLLKKVKAGKRPKLFIPEEDSASGQAKSLEGGDVEIEGTGDEVEGDKAVNKANKYNVGEDERREIGDKIQKNRGLMVQRKRATKTPRMKYKEKYEKKLKKRKGQVQPIRSQQGRYGGEAAGINVRAVRSRKFK